MAITLAQAQVNSLTDVDFNVVDSFRRYDGVLMDRMVFDDIATPGSGGGAMVYGYNRLVSAASASPRNINEEYIPGKATRQLVTVQLKPFGGAFELDRVLRNLGPAATNEISFQMQQLMVAARIRISQEIVLGDTAVDSRGFDGLSKVLTGGATEVTGATLDISPATIVTQVLAMAALDKLDNWLATIVPSRTGSGDMNPGSLPPGELAILGNTVSITRVRALARWAAMYSVTTDDMGRKVERYGPWLLIDIGNKMDGSGPIIPIGAAVAGETDLYAVSFGMDALHGASLAGVPLVQTFLPDWSQPAAVKLTELEFGPIAVVLKNTLSAGVYRKVKVQ